MKIYIITREFWNTSSEIKGVYLDEKIALARLANMPNEPVEPWYSQSDHFKLDMWNLESNSLEARWTNQKYANEWTIEEHEI